MPSTDLVRVKRPHNPVLRAARAPARGIKALTQMVFGRSGSVPGLLYRFSARHRFDYAREVGDGMSSSLLMAPILWMARTFPEAPLQVLDPDGEVIEKHPLILKLRRPNPFYSGIVLWMATLLSWVLDGNGYWIKVTNQAGTGLNQLWYAPHWMLEPVSDDPETFITHYWYTVDGVRVRLEPEEVVHFRYGLDPHNPRKGLSPLGSLFQEIFSDQEAANFAASLLKNMGVPGLVISPDGGGETPDPSDVEATKEYVEDEVGGHRRGKPLVMSGPTKVEQFGFNPQQMDLSTLRRVPEERVTAILGLPAVVVGLGAGLERSTFNNYSEAREAAYESNIIPTQRLMAEEIRHQLLIPDYQDGQDAGEEVAFDLRQVRVLQDDRNEEAKRLGGLYTDGVITRAEARKPLGHEVTEADDVYSIPVLMTITPAGEMPYDSIDRYDDIDKDDIAKARLKHRRKTRLTRAQAAVVKAMERGAVKLRHVFATEFETALDALGMQAADEFEKLAKGRWDVSTKADQAAGETDQDLADAVTAKLGLDAWKERVLKQLLETHYLRTAATTVDTLNTVLELGVELEDPVERKIVAEGGARAGLVDIDDATRKAIYQALSEARVEGLGPAEAAKRIREYVPAGRFVNAGPKYRALMIARTETKNAQNLSSLAAYNASGTVTKVLCLDGEGDAICAERDGQTFTLDDASDEGLAHPNCTLNWAPIVG